MTTLAIAAATFAAGMAAMYVPARLARYDARQYNALAEDKLTECEARDAVFEETRNKPWHYAAIETAPEPEPADEDAVNGEVLHVEHATGELYKFGPNHPGWVDLAEEVGLVRALSDESEHKPTCPDLFYCPTVGEIESGCHGGFDVCCAAPELHQPVQALSDRPAEDEDEVGDEQPGEAIADAPASLRTRFRAWRREQWTRIRVLCRVRRVVNEPYRGRHWVSDVQHTAEWPVINPSIPAQRSGDADE